MKKVISLVLVVVMMLGCVGLVACGGEEGVTTPPPEEAAPPPPEEEAPPPPPPAGGLTWNDMPVYPGVNQVQKGAWSIPPEEGEWSRVEWRYYETGDSVSTVVAFYKSQMPGNGWEETFWMEMDEMRWGYYSKNNEQDAAMVWVGSDEGKTFVALMRATE